MELAAYDLTKYSGLVVEYECDDPACEVFVDIGTDIGMGLSAPNQRQFTDQQGKIEVNLDEEVTLDDPNPGRNSCKTKEYDSADTYTVYLRMCPGTTLSVGKSVTITKLTLIPREEA